VLIRKALLLITIISPIGLELGHVIVFLEMENIHKSRELINIESGINGKILLNERQGENFANDNFSNRGSRVYWKPHMY
jgi:hypothetical protein